jgi:hypothetical protein
MDGHPSTAFHPSEMDDKDLATAELSNLVRDYRRVLYMCAASCQGGHSIAGDEAARLLGIAFPIRMENLKRAALIDGFDPDALWPWLRKMEVERERVRAREEAGHVS